MANSHLYLSVHNNEISSKKFKTFMLQSKPNKAYEHLIYTLHNLVLHGELCTLMYSIYAHVSDISNLTIT